MKDARKKEFKCVQDESKNHPTGFTLVEILITLGLFSILASCLMAGTLQVRRIAENTIFENTALNIATGYQEQIKSMPYDDIVEAINTEGKSLSSFLLDGEFHELQLNEFNYQEIIIRKDPDGNPVLIMPFWIKPVIIDQNSLNGNKALQIRIVYKWIGPETNRERVKVLRTLRSWVETY